jgi:sulfatase modifying factor 1
MAKIPGGKLKMGRDDGKKSEAPAHEVTVKDFFIDTREVTVAAYRECVAAKKCPEPTDDEFCNFHKKDRDNHPINCVDFKSAEAFCAFAGKRLPTEQEWERAARGDDGRKYPWGAEEPNMDLLCWKRLKEKLGTCEVSSRPKGASPYGVLDMAGNVNEWTSRQREDAVARDARQDGVAQRRGHQLVAQHQEEVHGADLLQNSCFAPSSHSTWS